MTPNLDPRNKYPRPPTPEQHQAEQPGATDVMDPPPDHGEESYQGSGRLTGLRTLITGGDSGIGRAVAIAFAREGANVAISYLPSEQDDADATQSELAKTDGHHVQLPGDLRDEANCVATIERTVTELGGIDVLVLNAGTQHRRDPNAAITRDQILEVFETNLVAPLILMREAAPFQRRDGRRMKFSSEQTPLSADRGSQQSWLGRMSISLPSKLRMSRAQCFQQPVANIFKLRRKL